jgi:hypothetical protein
MLVPNLYANLVSTDSSHTFCEWFWSRYALEHYCCSVWRPSAPSERALALFALAC